MSSESSAIHSSARQRQVWPILLFSALFIACVIGAYAWFNLDQPAETQGLWLEARKDVSGYTFAPETVPEEALAILGTTNITNGSFLRPDTKDQKAEGRIPLFLATWGSKQGKKLTVIHHTPDICWVGAGWTPTNAGQPRQIALEFPLKVLDANRSTIGNSDDLASPSAKLGSGPSTVRLPFECRVFKSPNGASKVLVIWCTLVGGQVLSESDMFSNIFKQTEAANPDGMIRMAAPARRLVADQLWQAVCQRRAARGVKQFVRLSMVISENWSTSLEQIKRSAVQVVSLSNPDLL